MNKLSLMRKFLFLLVPLFFVGAGVSFFTYFTLASSSEDLAAANEVNDLALKSRTYVAEMGSALKGYLLNPKDQQEADRKKEADKNNSDAIETMKKIVKNPDILKIISELSTFDSEKLDPAENKVIEYVSAGNLQEAQQYFIKHYLPLRLLYDDLSKSLVELANQETKMQVKKVEEKTKSSTRSIIISLILGLLGISGAIILTVKNLSRSLSALVENLSQGAETLSSSSFEIKDMSSNLSDSSTQQAAAIQQTVSSIEEVSSMVEKNAENAQRSSQVSNASQAVAEKGKQMVAEMISSVEEISQSNRDIMKEIDQSNSEISEIVKLIIEIDTKTQVINDIVFQTKLLSFNASVEAARAGEHGKGFAVVAEEVGNLAQMSGAAAKEISVMLDGSIQKVEGIVNRSKTRVSQMMVAGSGKVEAGAANAKRCGEVLDEILNNAVEANQLVDEIANACREQAHGVKEINSAMLQLDSVTQQNALSSQRSAGSAEQLNQSTIELKSLVGSLYQTINGKKAA